MAAQKPSGSLKKFLDSKRVETRLVGPIERHWLTKPVRNDRRWDVLHPSDLVKTDFCKRAAYFVLLRGKQEERPSLRLQSIFDEGHFIHRKWQNWIRDGGWLYGRWHCQQCGERFFATSPTACEKCGSVDSVEYNEVPLEDPYYMIEGHSDGWVKGLGEDFLIEIKSIGPGTIRMEDPMLLSYNDLAGAWKELRRPFSTHVRQGQLYLEIARRMYERGEIPSYPREIVFLYELKMDQSYKEFVMPADPSYVEICLAEAAEIVEAFRSGGEPPSCSRNPEVGCKHCQPYDAEEVA